MRLEDICETPREKRARRLLYRERFGIPIDKEPLIGVVGVGKVAKIYCTLLTSHMNSFLYKPKICLVGRGEKESDFKRRHLDHETKLPLDKDRVFPMNYQDFSEVLNKVDLVFVTLGADTNQKSRESMYKSSLKTMGPLLSLPWNVFPGLIDILTNPSEVIAQKVLKEIQKSGGLKDPGQVMCNGPLDLLRIQYVIRDRLRLEVEPHKIRVSVGGTHLSPFVSLENVLVEQGLSSSGIPIYRDITPLVQGLNEILKKDGTSIVKEAQKIPYSSFELQEGYEGVGTPTDISTAESMLALTQSIINRFGSTAVSILEDGLFKYKNVHFTHGLPEQDEERVQSFSVQDLREIETRNNGSRKVLRKNIGSDYEIHTPSDISVLESIFCPRGRQEPEELKKFIIKESLMYPSQETKINDESNLIKSDELARKNIEKTQNTIKEYSICSYSLCGYTHLDGEDYNQDFSLIGDGLFGFIADGFGNEKSFKLSKFAVEEANSYLLSKIKFIKSGKTSAGRILKESIHKSHQRIKGLCKSNMGTTLTAWYIEHDKLYIAWVGDSPVVLVRRGYLDKITTDHRKIQSNLILPSNLTEYEAVTMNQGLIRYIGQNTDTLEIDLETRTLERGDTLMITTRGLTRSTSYNKVCDALTRVSLEESINILEKNYRNGDDELLRAVVKRHNYVVEETGNGNHWDLETARNELAGMEDWTFTLIRAN